MLPSRGDLVTIRRSPARDLLAGGTVAIVALPLALGFGVASGLGAAAGLATAVVAGAIAAIFGGSNYQVSGPTGAMTVVLVPIVARYGAGGVLTVGLMAGVLLIGLALARAGRHIRLIPAPVVEGFTVGIAAVIFLQQIPAALGVAAGEGENVALIAWQAVRDFAAAPAWPAITLAGAVAAVMLVGARWKPQIPFSLLAVTVATGAAVWARLDSPVIGALPATLPSPSIDFLDPAAIPGLTGAAVAVAALAALESLLSATVADGMTVGSRHDPDRELFGQGLANLAAPLFGGVPATAAIARTAVNVRSGASSRLAALAHAIVLALIMFAAAPLVAHIPLAALAGVLLATAVRMIEVGSVRVLVRASRSDAAILVLTAAVTLAIDLVWAVICGLVVAGALALRKIAASARIETVPLTDEDHHLAEHALLAEHIVAYRIDGPLFFAAAHRFLLTLTETADVRVAIIRLSRVTAIDATGALVLRDAVERLEARGVTVYLSGMRPEHAKTLEAVDLLDRFRKAGKLFEATPGAIAAARSHLTAIGVIPRPQTAPDRVGA
ncbi:SulP family inorganic anion transporter [Glycomyces sp. YM15]|uniref:SulP family inorganic anion transporter n=1 Tax=Glycomyces sp. YM15 TaxID=2800446 RepID=UPI0035AC2161